MSEHPTSGVTDKLLKEWIKPALTLVIGLILGWCIFASDVNAKVGYDESGLKEVIFESTNQQTQQYNQLVILIEGNRKAIEANMEGIKENKIAINANGEAIQVLLDEHLTDSHQ